MKLAPTVFATMIVMLTGASAGFAQDRYQGSGDRPQYGAGQNDREQAADEGSERGAYRHGGRGGYDESRQGDDDNFAYGQGQTAQGRKGHQMARFRFARGNARFDIRCPANGQMRECIEAASQFIRLMNQAPETNEKGADTGSAPKL